MIRFRLTWLMAFSILLSFVVAPPQPVEAQQNTKAFIRAVNAVPDSTRLSVYLNNAVAANGLTLGNAFGYFEVPAGKHQVSFRPGSGKLPSPNAAVDLDLAPGDFVTVIALNKLANLQALVLHDDVSPVVRGQVRVRVIHTVVDGADVDVMTTDGKMLVSKLAFGAASDPVLVDAGTYNLQVTASGNTQTILARLANLNFRRERRIDIFVLGEAGKTIRAVATEASTLKASGTNQIRFGNFIQNGGLVDVSINNEPAFIGVRFGDVTSFALVVAPGDYRLDIFPVGRRDRLILSGTVTVNPDQSVFVAAVGDLDGQIAKLELKAFEEDFAPVRSGRAHMQFIHLAAGTTDVALQLGDGTTLLQSVPFGTSGRIEVGIGNINLRVVQGGGTRLVNRIWAINAGTGNIIILYDSDPAAPGVAIVDYEYDVGTVVPIRFVHASTRIKGVDVYLDGDKVLADWQFGATTDYIDLTPGEHEIEIFEKDADPKNATTRVLIARDLNVGDTPLTVLAFDDFSGTTLRVFPDNLRGIGQGRARVRLIQASPEVGTVRWYNAAGQTPIINLPIGPGSASSAVDLAAGSYIFLISSVTDPNIILRLPPTQLGAGSFTTFVVTSPNADEVITLSSTVAPGTK